MASSQQHRCVFVGNIPYDATEEQLIQICEEVGPVVSFRLVIDRETGKPKGYGFCEYKDEETALSARRNLQGYEINGRQLRVDFAENDKGSDRNREQGRGGPGMVTNVADGQKQLGGPVIGANPTLHQPIGVPIAMTAASVMAGVLGGGQTSQINQTGLQNQSSVGNDPLTHHLAKMSKSQLNQVLHELKGLSMQNKDLARQLLLVSPQLPKALFQAQIMLGMVTPQMLQMPNIRQQVLNPPLQPSVAIQGQQPTIQAASGLPPFAPLSVVPSSLGQNKLSAPFPLPPQPRVPPPNLSQMAVPPQIGAPAQSGPLSLSSARPQPLSGPQMPTLRPALAPPLQQAGHASQLAIPNANLQPFPIRPVSSDSGYQPVSSVRLGLVETNAAKDTSMRPQLMSGVTSIARKNMPANVPPLSDINGVQDQMMPPSKLQRLDDGRGAPVSSSGSAASGTPERGPSNVTGSKLVAAGQTSGMETPSTEKQTSQLQLPPDVESSLLQQVLSLTPEQLSSLPPDQQQQVIQLQQMLR